MPLCCMMYVRHGSRLCAFDSQTPHARMPHRSLARSVQVPPRAFQGIGDRGWDVGAIVRQNVRVLEQTSQDAELWMVHNSHNTRTETHLPLPEPTSCSTLILDGDCKPVGTPAEPDDQRFGIQRRLQHSRKQWVSSRPRPCKTGELWL